MLADLSAHLLGSGAVQCWGYNSNGQLGNNTTTQSNVPVQAQGMTGSVQGISLGDNHTCAVVNGTSPLRVPVTWSVFALAS